MSRLVRIGVAALLPAVAAIGCSSDSAPLPPANLSGTWAQPNEVPGSSYVWTLSVNGSAVSGTGTWSGEACCGGTIALSGEVTYDDGKTGVERLVRR